MASGETPHLRMPRASSRSSPADHHPAGAAQEGRASCAHRRSCAHFRACTGTVAMQLPSKAQPQQTPPPPFPGGQARHLVRVQELRAGEWPEALHHVLQGGPRRRPAQPRRRTLHLQAAAAAHPSPPGPSAGAPTTSPSAGMVSVNGQAHCPAPSSWGTRPLATCIPKRCHGVLPAMREWRSIQQASEEEERPCPAAPGG